MSTQQLYLQRLSDLTTWRPRKHSSATRRFRLLDLPAEIREAIFEYAVVSDKPLVAFRLDEYQRDDYQEAIQPALTRVNRAVRDESLPLFYGSNTFILQTTTSRAVETRSWLKCNAARLPMLYSLSLWLRYVDLTNDRSSTNGAICISLRRSRRDGVWQVADRWEWITVARRPGAVQSDAKFLIEKLRQLLVDKPGLDAPDDIRNIGADLKMFYIQEKMS